MTTSATRTPPHPGVAGLRDVAVVGESTRANLMFQIYRQQRRRRWNMSQHSHIKG